MGFEAPPDVTVRLTPLGEVTPCGATVTRPEKVQPAVAQLAGAAVPELRLLYCDIAGSGITRKAKMIRLMILILRYHPRE
jgi:hypothetical protein